MLRGYQKSISEITGVTDQAVVAQIEGAMYDQHRTLDGMSHGQFSKAALEAHAFVRYITANPEAWQAEIDKVLGA